MASRFAWPRLRASPEDTRQRELVDSLQAQIDTPTDHTPHTAANCTLPHPAHAAAIDTAHCIELRPSRGQISVAVARTHSCDRYSTLYRASTFERADKRCGCAVPLVRVRSTEGQARGMRHIGGGYRPDSGACPLAMWPRRALYTFESALHKAKRRLLAPARNR